MAVIAIILIVLLVCLLIRSKIPSPPEWQTQDPPRQSAMTLEQVDAMTGEQFEGFVARLLRRQGYECKTTARSGDKGVDIVAWKDGRGVAVQCKRQVSAVDGKAVAAAVAGKPVYQFTEAWVVKNSRVTPGARTLAEGNDCRLVDRRRLGEWIDKYHPYAVD